MLRVVRGEPTDEELAAVVVALATRAGQPPAPPRVPVWRDHARRLGVLRRGPDTWRASALPR